MFDPTGERSGPSRGPGGRPEDPLGLGGLLGTDLSGVFGSSPRQLLGSLGLPSPPEPAGAKGAREPPDSPDRVSRMPGGAEVVRRRRKERAGELLQELLNVSIGSLAALLAVGGLAVAAGAGLALAAVVGGAVAGGYGYVLGREVLSDLTRLKERSERDTGRW